MSVTLRSQVLGLYSRIFRVARHWEAQDPNETKVERNYIVDEARALFRENKGLVQDDEIRMRMMEAEARLAMAEHYRNSYPRLVNLHKTLYTKQEVKKIENDIQKIYTLSRRDEHRVGAHQRVHLLPLRPVPGPGQQ